MKKLFVLLSIHIFFIISILLLDSCSLKEYEYCGKVTEMYRVEAGYKVSAESHIVIYCDSIKRKIDVKVDRNSYANTVIGETVCFELQEWQTK